MPDENNTQETAPQGETPMSNDQTPEPVPPVIEVPVETPAETTPTEVPPATEPAEQKPAETSLPTPPASGGIPALPSVPAPTPSTSSGPAISKSFLQKALEKIQFRKRKKLDKILALAQQKGSITNDQVQKLLHCSKSSAERYLNQLEKESRLKQIGKTGVAVRYELSH